MLHRKKRLPGNSLTTRVLAIALVILFLGLGISGRIRSAKSVFTSEGNFNLLVQDNGYWLVSLDVFNKEMTALKLPAKMEVGLPYGKGRLQLDAASVMSKREGGGLKLLSDGILMTLGMGLDGWVEKGPYGLMGFRIDGGITKLPIWRWTSLWWTQGTSLGIWDRIKVWWLVSHLGSSKVKVVDLAVSSSVTSKIAPDGFETQSVDQSRIKLYQSLYFKDRKIAMDAVTVEVLNSTEIPNLARAVGEILLINGVRVVMYGAVPQIEEKCLIYAHEQQRKSYTIFKISNWLGCEFRAEDREGRSEVRIVLGKKFGEFWARAFFD